MEESLEETRAYLHTPQQLHCHLFTVRDDGTMAREEIHIDESGECTWGDDQGEFEATADPARVLALFHEVEEITRNADDQVILNHILDEGMITLVYPIMTVTVSAAAAWGQKAVMDPVFRFRSSLFKTTMNIS